jgi:hypothetical protein
MTYAEQFATTRTAPALMTQFHEKHAARVAHQLGAAARAAGHTADPQSVPGLSEALCGLGESDPLVVTVYAAYKAGFEAVA